MRHWRIYNLFMTTCYMYKITIIIILYVFYIICIFIDKPFFLMNTYKIHEPFF